MKFELQHVALYTKGWYDRSDNIWYDILKCLQGDNRLGWIDLKEPISQSTKDDILSIIIRNVAPMFNKELKDFAHDLVFEINPATCWRYGYYHTGHTWTKKDKLKGYDYQEATLWYFLSKIQGELLSNLESLPDPDDKILPVGEERLKRFSSMKFRMDTCNQ